MHAYYTTGIETKEDRREERAQSVYPGQIIIIKNLQ